MKFHPLKPFSFLFLVFFSVIWASPVIVEIDNTAPQLKLSTQSMFGADLAIWNSPSRYQELKPALTEIPFNYFRFPNGSLANDYHWNGVGRYDSTGVWHSSDSTYAPGFLGETLYRGTSKDNWGFARPSHLTDHDTSTLWWGALYDKTDPPWVVFEFLEAVSLDSLEILWGDFRPQNVELAYWTLEHAVYPGVHQSLVNHLKRAAKIKVSGSKTKAKLSTKSKYFALRFDSQDLPKEGVQIREVAFYSQGRNVLDNPKTKIYAISTRYGDFARTDWTGIPWDFESFMEYIQQFKNSEAVIGVNAATGMPQEAAAWVKYANQIKKYNIKNWQVGNELDGEWEEAGPLSARQYAMRFLDFARAMKAVDSTILLHAPLYSSYLLQEKGAGLLDGRYWMEEFLRVVGEAEKKEQKRFLDVVDLHAYPYWADNNLNAKDLIQASLKLGPNLDTLSVWMQRHLEGKRRVHLSEFASTILGTEHLMRAVHGASMANLAAQFITRFGDRGHLLPWDTYGGMYQGPDSSWGTMSLSLLAREGSWNNWGPLEPTAEYFGVYMAFSRFAKDAWSVYPTVVSDPSVAAYAIGEKDSSRVLLVNFTEESKEVQLHRKKAKKSRIQVDVFSEDQYRWVGRTAKAYPNPAMGPMGMRLRDSSVATFKLAPLSVAVVHFETPLQKDHSPKALHLKLLKSVVLAGDTLELFGTVYQKEGQLTYAKLRIPDFKYSKSFKPQDSLWNASIESFSLKIPIPKEASLGKKHLYIDLMGLGNQSTVLEVPFRVRGEYRSTSIIEDFESPLDSINWFPVTNGDNRTSMDAKIVKGGPPQGNYMRHDFFIEQPVNQTWPNFAGAHYPAPPKIKNSVGIVLDYATHHDNPKGYHEVLFTSTQVKDYDEFMYRLKNTRGAWVRDTILWADLKQEGWGLSIEELLADKIKDFVFRGRFEGKGYISLDNLYVLGESGEELKMPLGLRRLR